MHQMRARGSQGVTNLPVTTSVQGLSFNPGVFRPGRILPRYCSIGYIKDIRTQYETAYTVTAVYRILVSNRGLLIVCRTQSKSTILAGSRALVRCRLRVGRLFTIAMLNP